jgi:hypothetical protein
MSGFSATPLSDGQADQILAAVRSMLSLQLTSPQHVAPGGLITAQLVPTSPMIDASALVNGFINIAVLTKNVLFQDASVADIPDSGDLTGDTVASALPNLIQSALPYPPATSILNGGQTVQPAGALEQLFGAFGLPRLDVKATVGWVVRNPAGQTLAEGRDFVAPGGLGSPTVSLVIPPVFRELRLDTLSNPLSGSSIVCLYAEVALQLGSRALSFELGGIPLLLLPLFVPTLVAMFTEPSFEVTSGSAVIVMVPEHSGLTSIEGLVGQLQKIENVLDSVRSLAGIATWLVGLDALVASIPEQPRVRFVVAHQANGIGFLDRITLGRRPWYDFLGDDPRANDRISSLIVLGLPATGVSNTIRPRVECYNAISYQTVPEGYYIIEVDPPGSPLPPTGYAMIRYLDSPVAAAPTTFPPGRLVEWLQDFKAEEDDDDDKLWHHKLSSVRFADSYIEEVNRDINAPVRIPILRCLRLAPPVPPGETDDAREP